MIRWNADGSIRDPFLIRVLHGEARLEDVNDEVEAWHTADLEWEKDGKKYSASPDPLHHWLGLTEAEYARFVRNESALREIVEERKALKDDRRRTLTGGPINPEMREGRYQDTLRRFRDRIAAGLDLNFDDSTFTGDKYTDSTWGLCSCRDANAYPDVNDHTFPLRIVEDMNSKHGILPSERSPPKGATCPLDRGRFKPDKLNPGSQGCFYRCMLFRPVKGTLPGGERHARLPTREETLKLYDDLIAEREAKFGRKTTADDGESNWVPSGKIKGKFR